MATEIYCSTEGVTTQGRYQFNIEEDRIFNNETKGGEVIINLIVDDAGIIAKIPARDFISLSDISVAPTKRLSFQFKCYPENTEVAIRSKRQQARQDLFTNSIVWKRWLKNKWVIHLVLGLDGAGTFGCPSLSVPHYYVGI